jgi:hypothetical protein
MVSHFCECGSMPAYWLGFIYLCLFKMGMFSGGRRLIDYNRGGNISDAYIADLPEYDLARVNHHLHLSEC